jgi:peroxin-16
MPSTNAPPPKPTLHNRYTKFWSKKSPLYRKVAILITIIQYTELLWEMAAKRRGEQTRWRVVIGLEAAKALCRLILLRLTKGRPLLTQPLPEREAEPEQLPPSSSNESTAPSTPPSEAELSWKMPRTGFHLPTLPSNISAYLLSRVLTPDDIKPAPSLLPNLHGSAILAEVLYILRPLIYVIMLEKYADDKKSWKPWLVGFGIEYASRELLKKKVGGYGTLEKEEMARREWGLMWWAARSAGYENLVGPWVKGMTEGMKGKPLVGMLAGVVEDYQYLWDNYYFSTATL